MPPKRTPRERRGLRVPWFGAASGSRLTSAFRAPKRVPIMQIAKSAVAISAAWLLAELLIDGPPPVFAAIAALLVVQPSLNQSFARAIERSVGVVAGVAVASALGLVFGNGSWVILVAATAGLLLAWALRLTPGATNQIGISAILVLALGQTTPGYAVDRVLETVLGAAVGFVVNLLVVPPVAIAPARDAVAALGAELSASLTRLADALERPQRPAQLEELLLQARLMRPMRERAEQAIEAAAESLTFNPRGARLRSELEELRTRLDGFAPTVVQLIGMTRAFYDRYAPGVEDDPSVRAIATQLRRAAHDLDLVQAGGETPENEPPALTTPLEVVSPGEHWVLVGALLEDLHRIHLTLAERTAPGR